MDTSTSTEEYYPEPPRQGLYVDSEYVYEVMDENDMDCFKMLLAHSHLPAVVVFYSEGCAHCIHYKPRFSHFANVLLGTFRSAAVNCANPSLRKVCADFGIRAVPSVRMFTPSDMLKGAENDYDNVLPLLLDTKRYDTHYDGDINEYNDADNTEYEDADNTEYEDTDHTEYEDADHVEDADADHTEYEDVDADQTEYEDANHSEYHDGDNSYNDPHTSGPSMLVHLLPSDAIYFDEFVNYVANRLTIELSDWQVSELNKSVSETLFEHRKVNKMCFNEKWPVEEDAFPKRLHDAILGLNYILLNWIIPESGFISVSDLRLIMNFIELNRLYLPVKDVRYLLSNLLISLMPYIVNSTPMPYQEYQTLFKEDIYKYFVKNNNSSTDNTGSSEDKSVSANEGIKSPFLHCKTITCSIWQLFHIIGESMQWNAEYLLNKAEQCGDKIAVKGEALSSILPIHIYQQSVSNQFNYEDSIDVDYTIPKNSILFDARHVQHIKRALYFGEMDIKQLSKVLPDYGCQLYHPFTALNIIQQFFERFFQCLECRNHFNQNIKMNVFNLHEMDPSEEILSNLKTQSSQSTSDGDSKPIYVTKDVYKSVEYPKNAMLRLWLWRLHNSVTERVAVFQTISTLQGFSGYTDYAYCSVYWPKELASSNIINDDILSKAIQDSQNASNDVLENIPERLEDIKLDRVLNKLTDVYWDDHAL